MFVVFLDHGLISIIWFYPLFYVDFVFTVLNTTLMRRMRNSSQKELHDLPKMHKIALMKLLSNVGDPSSVIYNMYILYWPDIDI